VPSFSVSTTVLTAGPKATEAGFRIEASDEVEWTASSSSSDFTLSKTAGAGPADIKISFEANPSTESRSARVTVSTANESVETASWTVTITQGPASEGDIDDGTPGYDDHLIARRKFKRV
ncbi:MAG: BACON domain-containing protein, partial [Bacteroidales bacterium]|nr:BACON domain-containing protein [Bacteroidales bacterium]